MRSRFLLLFAALSFAAGCTTADKDYIRDHVVGYRSTPKTSPAP